MKLTPEQADVFHVYMRKWQTKLSLGDWRVEHGTKPAPKGAMACIELDEQARLAVYRLGDFGNQPITDRILEETAIHELLHVRLRDLVCAAEDRDEDLIEAQEHRVINVLEQLLYGND